jgi:hypothetical protein
MVGNVFKALSLIALVSLASLVGCVDVDDAPELGETADSVTSGAVGASGNATSEVSADVATVIEQECRQFDWGQVCSRRNEAGEFVGVFNNNRGGGNTVKITIWRDRPNEIVRICGYEFVAYGHSFRCVIYPRPDAAYNTCVRTLDERVGCSGWW